MVNKYIKKTNMCIEAIQWNGNNIREIRDFVGIDSGLTYDVDIDKVNGNPLFFDMKIRYFFGNEHIDKYIYEGDYIIKDITNPFYQFYPCDKEIFENYYLLLPKGGN